MTDYTIRPLNDQEILGEITPVGRVPADRKSKMNTSAFVIKGKFRKMRRNRRKNKYDRRKGVGGGVILSLSIKNDRRKQRDRRL